MSYSTEEIEAKVQVMQDTLVSYGVFGYTDCGGMTTYRDVIYSDAVCNVCGDLEDHHFELHYDENGSSVQYMRKRVPVDPFTD